MVWGPVVVILFAAALSVAAYSYFSSIGTPPQIYNKMLSNEIKQLFIVFSPDKTKKIFLEKEYDPNIKRYIRQSIALENNQTGGKIIVNEIKLTAKEAIVRYSEDGWSVDGSGDCVSLIDFNEFEPIKWLDNDKIEVNQYFDNYECAGKITNTIIYNAEGKKLSEKNNLSESIPD